MEVIKVNGMQEIEFHERFINIVNWDTALRGNHYYTAKDKRELKSVSRIDLIQTEVDKTKIAGMNKETTSIESSLRIIDTHGNIIVLDFLEKRNRDKAYELLKEDIFVMAEWIY